MSFLVPLVIFIIVYVTYRLLLHIYRQYTSPLWEIPGRPLLNPISGDLGEHIARDYKIEQVVQYDVTTYGSIFRTWHTFGQFRVHLSEPDWIKHVLVSNASSYPRGHYLGLEPLEILAGERNMISISGEYHKRLRRIATPGFRPAAIQACIGLVKDKAALMQEKWEKAIDHSEDRKLITKVQDDLTNFTLDCLGVAAMDLDFDSLRGSGADFTETILKIVRTAAFHSITPFIPFRRALFRKLHALVLSETNIDWIPPDKNGLSLSNIQKLVRKIRSKILACDTNTSTKCLLRTILASNEKGAIGQDEMIDLLIIFMLAGTETSSTGLSWTLWLLAANQRIQDEASRECSAYLAEGGSMTWNDITDENVLSLTKRILQESLRLYPPVPVLSRVCTKDDVIAGYTIPQGTEIIINIIGMHRNPAIWGEDVLQFNPDREFHEEAFLPFGDGIHKCIGYQLATLEMKIALVYLLSKFRFERLPGDTTEATAVITLVPKPPIELAISER